MSFLSWIKIEAFEHIINNLSEHEAVDFLEEYAKREVPGKSDDFLDTIALKLARIVSEINKRTRR